MPCYTEWDAYLDKGSEKYEARKVGLEARLQAVKHIADYYYGIEGLHVSPARHSGQQAHIEMAHLEFGFDKNDLRGRNEEDILKSIAHHCSCDEIHFTILYDLVTLLDLHNKHEAGYARIIMSCANEIRANMHQYRHAAKQSKSEGVESKRLDPKRFP